jgi:hypothetical protein
MKSLEPPVPDHPDHAVESTVSAAARHSAGLRCGGCGSEEIGLNWMIFDIEASSGPRDNSFSYKPTVTRGFLLCPECYLSPAAGILRNAISDMHAKPAPTDYGCITLCVKPRRDKVLGQRLRVPRKIIRCPACFRFGKVFKIGEETPHSIAELARLYE